MTLTPSQRLSYDLDERMLTIIGEEFSPQKVAHEFAKALASKGKDHIEKVGQEVFGNYGKSWMKRSLELGEKHTDATYETLKKAIAKTGVMYFPLKPQRFVEIAYLGVMSFLTLRVVQNNGEKFAYRLEQCDIYNSLREQTNAKVASPAIMPRREPQRRPISPPAKLETP